MASLFVATMLKEMAFGIMDPVTVVTMLNKIPPGWDFLLLALLFACFLIGITFIDRRAGLQVAVINVDALIKTVPDAPSASWTAFSRQARRVEQRVRLLRSSRLYKTKWARREFAARLVLGARLPASLERRAVDGTLTPERAIADCEELLCRLALNHWPEVDAALVPTLADDRADKAFAFRALGTLPRALTTLGTLAVTLLKLVDTIN